MKEISFFISEAFAKSMGRNELINLRYALPIQNLFLSILELRFFITFYCGICVLYFAARSYNAYIKERKKIKLNKNNIRAVPSGIIVLLSVKYGLIALFFMMRCSTKDFCSSLEFTPNFYFIFGVIDLLLLTILLVFNCISVLAEHVVNWLSIIFLYLIRILILFGVVEYYFSGIVLDFICVSFLIAQAIIHKDWLSSKSKSAFEIFTKICVDLKSRYNRNIEIESNTN